MASSDGSQWCHPSSDNVHRRRHVCPLGSTSVRSSLGKSNAADAGRDPRARSARTAVLRLNNLVARERNTYV
eukprot:1715146-Pyramimonas_sp.AAC.1